MERTCDFPMTIVQQSDRRDDGSQCSFIICDLYDFLLRRTILTENLACPLFGRAQLYSDMLHTRTATSRAQEFLPHGPNSFKRLS